MKTFLGMLLFVFIGCSFSAQIKIKDNPNQKCEMCGAEYYVDSDEYVAPTIKWCLKDANFCEEGFDIYKKTFDKNSMIEHCKSCVGCKCAIFSPDEWERLTKSHESKSL